MTWGSQESTASPPVMTWALASSTWSPILRVHTSHAWLSPGQSLLRVVQCGPLTSQHLPLPVLLALVLAHRIHKGNSENVVSEEKQFFLQQASLSVVLGVLRKQRLA